MICAQPDVVPAILLTSCFQKSLFSGVDSKELSRTIFQMLHILCGAVVEGEVLIIVIHSDIQDVERVRAAGLWRRIEHSDCKLQSFLLRIGVVLVMDIGNILADEGSVVTTLKDYHVLEQKYPSYKSRE